MSPYYYVFHSHLLFNLYEARAGVFQLLQTVVVGSVHDAQQRPGLEGDAPGVYVFY